MTIRLSHAQARALSKLDTREPRSPAEIGETRATCDALVVAGYATETHEIGLYVPVYTKIKGLRS